MTALTNRTPIIHAFSDVNSEYRSPLLVAVASVTVVGLLGWLSPASTAIAACAFLVLALLATLSPAGALGGVIVTLPYFYRPVAIDSIEIAASEILLLAATGGFGIQCSLDLVRSDSPSFRLAAIARTLVNNRLLRFLTLVTILGAVGVALTDDSSTRGAGLREWRWSFFEPLILLGLLIVSTRAESGRRFLAVSLIGAGVIAAAHGLLDIVMGGGVVADNVRRLSGPFPHPNALALFMVRPLILSLAILALLPRTRWWLALPVALTGFALLGTFSRGAWLAVSVAVAVIALDVSRRTRLALGSVAFVLLAGAVLIARDRMGNLLEGGSVSLRVDIWSSAIEMIRDRPITGYGPDQFLYVYAPRYINPTAWNERFTSHAHNLLADSWIRLGILGVIAAIVVLVTVTRRLISDRAGDSTRTTLSRAATIALGATLAHGLIDNAYFSHDLAMSAWLLAWLAFDERRSTSGNTAPHG